MENKNQSDIARLAELSQDSGDDKKGFLEPRVFPKSEHDDYRDNDGGSVSSDHSQPALDYQNGDTATLDRYPSPGPSDRQQEPRDLSPRRPSKGDSSGNDSAGSHRRRRDQANNADYYYSGRTQQPRYNRNRTVQSKEDLAKAEKCLTKIMMYKNLGFVIDESLSLKSPLEDLEKQVLSCIAHRKQKTALLTMQSSLLMFVGFMEFAATEISRFSPRINFRLKGLSESINEDIKDYDGLLGELYQDHSDYMPNNPWFALVTMLGNAAKMQHNKNIERENSIRQEMSKWEFQKSQQLQLQQQYQQPPPQAQAQPQQYQQYQPQPQPHQQQQHYQPQANQSPYEQPQHLAQVYAQPQPIRPIQPSQPMQPNVMPSDRLLQRVNKFQTAANMNMPTTSQPLRPLPLAELVTVPKHQNFASPTPRHQDLSPSATSPSSGRAQLSPSVRRLPNGNITQGLSLG